MFSRRVNYFLAISVHTEIKDQSFFKLSLEAKTVERTMSKWKQLWDKSKWIQKTSCDWIQVLQPHWINDSLIYNFFHRWTGSYMPCVCLMNSSWTLCLDSVRRWRKACLKTATLQLQSKCYPRMSAPFLMAQVHVTHPRVKCHIEVVKPSQTSQYAQI